MEPVSAAPVPAAMPWRAGTRRGTVGFFGVAQTAAGRWWLTDPAELPFFAKTVHGVRPAGPAVDGALPADTAARLRAWGFNTTGVGGEAGARDDGLPFLAEVDFCAEGPVIAAPGVRLPDVFDPGWPRLATARALAVCPALAENRELLGWVSDAAAEWGQPGGAEARPTLLQICLSLEPGFAAYHAAWEFVLALHGGRLEAVARAWGVPLPNKETVRERTRAEQGIATRGYARDEARWTRELARRYFTATGAAIRAADPNHLVWGCRFTAKVGAAVLAEAAYPAVDVAMPDWRELPPPGEGEATAPLFAGEVAWTTPEFLKLPAAARVLRLTSVEWMLRRGRTALERLARHPAVVGYAWSRWEDEPGEQPPFARGLVHANGAEAREHTELLAPFNARADALRRAE